MVIYNKAGKSAVGMGVNEYDNGVMNFFNKTDITFVDIGALEYGGGIRIKNEAGTVVALMEANESLNGAGLMIVFNKDGIGIVNIYANEYGGEIRTKNKDGIGIVDIGANIYDSGDIWFHNKTGDTLSFMGAYKNENGAISLFDKYGKLIGRLP